MPIRKEMLCWYPEDWKVRSKFVRFYRAKNRCEWCGAENYKPHPITGSKVILTTAHIFDEIDNPHKLLNLAGLCQKCHNGYDAKMRARGIKERKHKDQIGINF
jgi:5-methylcytosine-specific restriction endonuclease McrA